MMLRNSVTYALQLLVCFFVFLVMDQPVNCEDRLKAISYLASRSEARGRAQMYGQKGEQTDCFTAAANSCRWLTLKVLISDTELLLIILWVLCHCPLKAHQHPFTLSENIYIYFYLIETHIWYVCDRRHPVVQQCRWGPQVCPAVLPVGFPEPIQMAWITCTAHPAMKMSRILQPGFSSVSGFCSRSEEEDQIRFFENCTEKHHRNMLKLLNMFA